MIYLTDDRLVSTELRLRPRQVQRLYDSRCMEEDHLVSLRTAARLNVLFMVTNVIINTVNFWGPRGEGFWNLFASAVAAVAVIAALVIVEWDDDDDTSPNLRPGRAILMAAGNILLFIVGSVVAFSTRNYGAWAPLTLGVVPVVWAAGATLYLAVPVYRRNRVQRKVLRRQVGSLCCDGVAYEQLASKLSLWEGWNWRHEDAENFAHLLNSAGPASGMIQGALSRYIHNTEEADRLLCGDLSEQKKREVKNQVRRLATRIGSEIDDALLLQKEEERRATAARDKMSQEQETFLLRERRRVGDMLADEWLNTHNLE